jgi:hypothetical protein
MTDSIEIGRLLRAGVSGFIVGCRVSQLETPTFGGLVKVMVGDVQIFGVIHDIHIDDDGLVRQLVTAQRVDESVIADNRLNRNVPLEISVLSIGFSQNGHISHQLPPRPPLSLDAIYMCSAPELVDFTKTGHFGYFRHILQAVDLPIAEILAAHLQQAQQSHAKMGDPEWINHATQELIILLRDDYPTLMNVLGAVRDIFPG